MVRPRVLTLALCAGLGMFTGRATADTLRIANWNVTNYAGGRVPEFQTALYAEFDGRSLRPDVLIGQEFTSAAAVASFVQLLNTAAGSPGDWVAATFVDGPDTDSALFYRTTRVQPATELSPSGVTIVAVGGPAPNHPRNIMRFDLVLSGGTSAECRLAVYSTHMKAGTTASDLERRLLEAQRIRADAAALPPGWFFLLGGDLNIQTSAQAAYGALVGPQVGDAGRFHDPIATPGSWNNNGAFRFVHTQDPVGPGGMDDRHDQLLLCAALLDGAGLDYIGNPAVPYSTTTWNDPHHSYRAWGNDGTSFNQALTISGNTMVGPVIAQALVTAAAGAGHLPVFLDLRVPPCRFDVACDGRVDPADGAPGAECLSGPAGGPGWAGPSQFCRDYFDADADGDVDLADLAALQLEVAALP